MTGVARAPKSRPLHGHRPLRRRSAAASLPAQCRRTDPGAPLCDRRGALTQRGGDVLCREQPALHCIYCATIHGAVAKADVVPSGCCCDGEPALCAVRPNIALGRACQAAVSVSWQKEASAAIGALLSRDKFSLRCSVCDRDPRPSD